MSRSDPSVKVTIYLPKSLHQSSKEMSMVLLYLNRTYKTEVNFNKFPRERVEIYGESGAARRLKEGRPLIARWRVLSLQMSSMRTTT